MAQLNTLDNWGGTEQEGRKERRKEQKEGTEGTDGKKGRKEETQGRDELADWMDGWKDR